MNRDAIDKWMLLAESGELSGRRRRKLEEALAADPDAARRRAAIGRLQAVARAALDARAGDDAPPAPVRQWVARVSTGDTGRRCIRFARPALQRAAAAAVALFLVCAAGWWYLAHPTAPRGDTLGQLQTLVAVVSEYGFDAAYDAGSAEQDRIRELAQHLLLMQGFAHENVSEESAPWPEAPPTTLRQRSTDACLQERCG